MQGLFVRDSGDIVEARLVFRLCGRHTPRARVRFAAERHAVRSIHGPEDAVQIARTLSIAEPCRGAPRLAAEFFDEEEFA